MIRTRLSLKELHDISAFPTCPCAPGECQNVDGHWDMWQSHAEYEYQWLASMYGDDDNDLYYRYKDHVFVTHWEGTDQSIGETRRYIESIKEKENDFCGYTRGSKPS